jgi:predicted RNA binding protein YcfA (HicA-like mRNA interferase family)
VSNIDKLIAKMRAQPNGIRMSEADKVLKASGYGSRGQKGSHRQYVNKDGDVITLPDKTPLKAAYVVEILKRIDPRYS